MGTHVGYWMYRQGALKNPDVFCVEVELRLKVSVPVFSEDWVWQGFGGCVSGHAAEVPVLLFGLGFRTYSPWAAQLRSCSSTAALSWTWASCWATAVVNGILSHR